VTAEDHAAEGVDEDWPPRVRKATILDAIFDSSMPVEEAT